MKKYIVLIVAIIISSLSFAFMAYGTTTFNSNQVGTNPVNGYFLQTNGVTSTWALVSGGSGTIGPSTSTWICVFNSSSTCIGYSSFTFTSSTGVFTVPQIGTAGSGPSEIFVGNNGVSHGYNAIDIFDPGGNGHAVLRGGIDGLPSGEYDFTFPATSGEFTVGTGGASRIAYWTDKYTLTGLATGTTGYVLTASSTGVPYWAATSGGGSSTNVFGGTGISVAQVGTNATVTNIGVVFLNGSTGTILIYATSPLVMATGTASTTFSCPTCLTTSTYNASITINTASPLGGGGQLANNGALNLTWSNPGYVTAASSVTWSAAQVFNGTAGFANTTTFNSSTVFLAPSLFSSTSTFASSVQITSNNLIDKDGNKYVTSTSGGGITNVTSANSFISVATSTTNATLTFSSSTLAGTALNWTAAQTFGNTTTFNSSTIFSTVTNSLALLDSTGKVTAYGGASGCSAGQAVTTISAQGTTTCATTFTTSTLFGLFSAVSPITFNTSTGAIGITTSTFAMNADNLSGLANTSTARTNLGLKATSSLALADANGIQTSYAGSNCTAGSVATGLSATGTVPCVTTSSILAGYSTSTGANPTASVGSSTINGSANTFMRSDAAPALAPQYASSSAVVNYYDATTTAPYRYFQAVCPNKTITIGQISYAENAAATDTIEWVRTVNLATSTVDTLVATSTNATPVTSSTVTFATSTITSGTCLEGIVTSTVGTPNWSVFTIFYITD